MTFIIVTITTMAMIRVGRKLKSRASSSADSAIPMEASDAGVMLKICGVRRTTTARTSPAISIKMPRIRVEVLQAFCDNMKPLNMICNNPKTLIHGRNWKKDSVSIGKVTHVPSPGYRTAKRLGYRLRMTNPRNVKMMVAI